MPYYYKSRRKSGKRRAIRVYLAITLVCFVLAAGLSAIIDKGSALMERFHRLPWEKQEVLSIERLKKAYGGKMEDADLEKLINASEEMKDRNKLKKLKKKLEENFDTDEIKKLKEAYKDKIGAVVDLSAYLRT